MKLSCAMRALSIVILGGCALAPFAAGAHPEPQFPGAREAVAGPSRRVESASQQYDFTIRLLQPCMKDEAPCAGSGQVLVQRKGSREVLQTIDLPNLRFVPGAEEQASTHAGSAPSKADSAGIRLGDFNFDGHEDLAIESGRDAGYGGIGYEIYLFDPVKNRFFHSKAMSDLASRQMLFAVDADRKLLTSQYKSGCCYHMQEKYRVVRNVPVPVERHIEELISEKTMKITDEKRVGRRWRRKIRFEAIHASAD